MTQEEKLRLSRVLGTIDHMASWAEIDHRIYSEALERNPTPFLRGLAKGKVESAEYNLHKLSTIRSEIEQLIKEVNNV